MNSLTGNLRIKFDDVVLEIQEMEVTTSGGRINMDAIKYRRYGSFDTPEDVEPELKEDKVVEDQTPVIKLEDVKKQFSNEE